MIANDEINLKPCPFCGGPAEIRESRQCVDYEGEYMVYEVSICCAEENMCFFHPSTYGFLGETYGRALKGAAAAWNRRAAK